MHPEDPYLARREGRSHFVTVRGLRYHLMTWGDDVPVTPERPLLVMVHGWMDVGASFQFVVDALAQGRRVVAPDWRGFGRTDNGPGDTYWFADYLGDLDGLLDQLSPDDPVDLVGHSMGGNVVMLYAGARPQRIRRLVNLEGFGLPRTVPAQSPGRLTAWLDELKAPQRLAHYTGLPAVAQRLRHNNPRLSPAKAHWLAAHWARPDDDGRWHILGDPAHKRAGPLLYHVDEVLATWARITAPLLWVDGADTDIAKWWGDRFPRSEFDARLATLPDVTRHTLPDCGHMLHHDQPERLARLLEDFLGR